MRAALRGLTTRGRCLLAAGLAAAACSLVLGEKNLLRVAVFLLALPLLSVIMLARTRFRLACYRSVVPSRAAVGVPAEVQLRLQNMSILPTSLLLLEDDLPYTLGGRPRFTVERIGAGQTRLVCYTVRSDLRGRYPLGPLRLRLTDAFGLVELTRSFSATDRLTVVPAVLPLPPAHLPGARAVGSGATIRAVAARGEEDATTREYRHGDDLRKVHWRSTARVGKLMVRREEQPWQARATLLLDTRAGAHRGDQPHSSFEWAVTAIASIGAQLIRRGYVVSLVTDQGIVRVGGHSEGVLLDDLAVVRLSRGRGFEGLSATDRAVVRDGLFVAVVGTMTDDEARRLADARGGLRSSIAIVLDSPSWLGPTAGAAGDTGRVHRQAQIFGGNGWRVLPADRRSILSEVWAKAGAWSESPAVSRVPTGRR